MIYFLFATRTAFLVISFSLLVYIFIFFIYSLFIYLKQIYSQTLREGRIQKLSRANPDHNHKIIFVVKQNNIDELEKILIDVSDPKSVNYGKHWTREEVSKLTISQESINQTISFLNKNEIFILQKSKRKEYITTIASIQKWEKVLSTIFYEYEVLDEDGSSSDIVIRAENYNLPDEVKSHVFTLFNVIDFLSLPKKKKVDISELKKDKLSSLSSSSNGIIFGYVTPALLNQYYDIRNYTGNNLASQGIYASKNESYSPKDLAYFQEYFNLPNIPVANDIGGHVMNSPCYVYLEGILVAKNCGQNEANLDVFNIYLQIQYIIFL